MEAQENIASILVTWLVSHFFSGFKGATGFIGTVGFGGANGDLVATLLIAAIALALALLQDLYLFLRSDFQKQPASENHKAIVEKRKMITTSGYVLHYSSRKRNRIKNIPTRFPL